MDKKIFSLELHRSNKVTRIFQVVFGIICAIVAIIWVILNLNTIRSNATLWITIIFLLVFAYFQVASGLGLAEKFIEISQVTIRLRKNSVLPVQVLNATDIQKIEVFPVNIIFFLRSGKKVILRFGTTFTDTIEPVKTAIESYCSHNNINIVFREELI